MILVVVCFALSKVAVSTSLIVDCTVVLFIECCMQYSYYVKNVREKKRACPKRMLRVLTKEHSSIFDIIIVSRILFLYMAIDRGLFIYF